MSNTIVTVANDAQIVERIRTHALLLRELDDIEHTNTIDAYDFLSEQTPNLIILHAKLDDKSAYDVIKKIQKDEKLKTVPVILLEEKCTPGFLIETVDLGVSDIIHYPCEDWELLVRVMWNLQRAQAQTNEETKNRFISNLGVLQLNTGFYTPKYFEEFLKNEVDKAIKSKKSACVMLVWGEQKDKTDTTSDFGAIVKKSTRLCDSIGMSQNKKYYIFMPKTTLKGAYALFERIKKNSGLDWLISASVVEVLNKPFVEFKEALENGLTKSLDDNSLIVASDIVKINKPDDVSIFKNKNVRAANLPRETMAELEKYEIDDRNESLYRQAFQKKCDLVIEPVFKKFKEYIEQNNEFVYVEYKIDTQCYFKVVKDVLEAALMIYYQGTSKIKIDRVHISTTQMKEIETEELELVGLNYAKLSKLLKELLQTL